MYSDGFKYWLAFKKGNKKYYRCCRYKSKATNCPGRCVVESNNQIRNTNPHDHPADHSDQLVDIFRKVLTQRSATEPQAELYTIYWEEATQRHSEAAMLYTYQMAESCMRKSRRKSQPNQQTPTTLLEIDGLLKTSDIFQISYGAKKDPFYQSTISLEDNTCVIFIHARTIREIGKIDFMHVDSSIEVTPQASPTYHLMTIHALKSNQCTPIVYVIMTAKTLAGYSAVFAFLRERFSEYIVPSNIITDFDDTIHGALNLTFPEATVKGCWFNYVETILGQVKAQCMTRETSKGNGFSGLRMLLVLPLLPANYMTPGLGSLKGWLKEKNIFSAGYQNLCDYVEQSWINCVGAEKLSIFGLSHTVRNYVHQFNKDLMSNAGMETPMIWHMLESLTHLASKCYVRLNKKLKGMTPAKKQPRCVVEQENTVNSATQLWIRTAVHLRNPLQFLQMCSHCITDEFLYEVEERSLSKAQSNNDQSISFLNSITANEQHMSSDNNCSLQNYPLSFVTENFLLSETDHLSAGDANSILEAVTMSDEIHQAINTIAYSQQQQQQQPQQIVLNKINTNGNIVQQIKTTEFQQQKPVQTFSLDPPPLAFYHKVAKTIPVVASEPPPLVPISRKKVV